jgi:(1->4)-alpha-D-glucan 1-alpha-D-glucosylmutase
VYRTYVQPDRILERDVRYIESAVAFAKRRNPAMSRVIFDFIRDVLLLRAATDWDESARQQIAQFVGKFQQLTGPIMAKAVEDTALYRFTRLISLNEVGGEPAVFGTSAATLHAFNQSRLPRYAHSLNASSTHDTKRSEDLRARISVLSEIPREWRDRVRAWSRAHRRLKAEVDGFEAPSRNSEYLLYQTLVGLWPDHLPTGAERQTLVERLQEHLLKVEREAKVHTSWVSPNEAYEAAVHRFVAAIFSDRRGTMLEDIDRFARRVAQHGRWNSLSQLLLKIASPGIPDFFQGMEIWQETLVDPDNRRPVDFTPLRSLLDQVRNGHPVGLESGGDGRIKMFVTHAALEARRRCPDLFAAGNYLPLEVRGKFADCVFAFARSEGESRALVIVPRWTVRVSGFGGPPPIGLRWEDTSVVLSRTWPVDAFINLFTKEPLTQGRDQREQQLLPLSEIFHSFPLWLSLHGCGGESDR